MKYTSQQNINYKGNYDIYCYTYETQYNWGHIVKIYNKDTYYLIGSNKITYYNRTWERYRYQSCILGAIYNLIEERKQHLIDEYKLKTGKKRTTKEEKEIAIANDSVIDEYKEMRKYFENEYKGGY